MAAMDVKIEKLSQKLQLRANVLSGKDVSIEKQLMLLQFIAATLGISMERRYNPSSSTASRSRR